MRLSPFLREVRAKLKAGALMMPLRRATAETVYPPLPDSLDETLRRLESKYGRAGE